MKRILLALAIVTGTLGPLSSSAAAPPVLTGDNILKTTGSRVVTVSIPRKLAVTWYDPIWNGVVTTNGTYAGYALVQLTPRRQGRIIMVMQLKPPAGCRLDGTGCTAVRIHYLKGPSDSGRVNMSGGISTILEAGTYNLYGFTDAGKSLTANVDVKGLTGKKTWTATSPAYMTLTQSIADAPAGAGTVQGKLSGRLSNRGLVIGGVWATASNGIDTDDPSRTATGGATLVVSTNCWEKKTAAADQTNTCGSVNNATASAPDLGSLTNVDNLGRGTPLFTWKTTGDYSYAYNALAASQPLGRFGAYALWWTTG